MTLRNTRKNQDLQLETRQAQLFMNYYENYRSQEFRKNYYDYIFNQEWINYDDFMEKYGPANNMEAFSGNGSIIAFNEGIGYLLKNDLIDIQRVDDLLRNSFHLFWRKFESYLMSAREALQIKVYPNVEYLANELTKYHEEHPELKT
ncbi:MAG: DUF4760 domain-containing protein [Promethearchaeota archaeon]